MMAAQTDSVSNEPLNAVNKIVQATGDNKLTIGAYGHVDFTKQVGDTARHNAFLDVNRLVMFMGYKFNKRTHFASEVEFEHVSELYVEQAFINYHIRQWIDFRAGLMVIPMGIISEYHEPTTFNGVLRPQIDANIVPTTWREIGLGITGKFDAISLKYQLYAVNGFSGYDGGGKFSGSSGLRGGRQKGSKSYMTSPDFSAKLDYYGVPGLKIGVAGYFGESESKLYEGLWLEDSLDYAQKRADSSVVGIMMMGFDLRYQWKGIELRGQYILANLSNTEKYNRFTGKDLGSAMNGFYAELGYNLLETYKKTEDKLVIFARYESYDTHAGYYIDSLRNDAYNRSNITIGLGYKMSQGSVIKADYQTFSTAKDGDKPKNYINLGIGIWF